MKFNQQVDKKAILILLGCYCNNPRLLKKKEFETNERDYPEDFHKLIWGAITNLCRKGKVEDITPMMLDTEMSQFEYAYSIWNHNNGWEYITNAKLEAENEIKNIGRYRDDVRKYSIIRSLVNDLKMDVSFIYDEDDPTKMSQFCKLTSDDLIKEINSLFVNFKDYWRSTSDSKASFHAGDNIKDRIESHKNQENTYGYPFQSQYLTTIFKGMRPRKFIIRSSISGGGKSRACMSDSLNIASDYIYDWNTHEWVYIGEKEAVLYISTELTKEEIQDCLLAHISGIPQDEIEEWKNMTDERIEVLNKAAELMESCELYCEYTSDFTIDSITELIESYVINKDIKYAFFDYINDSPSLYAYYYEKTKSNLRTDQILFMFSEELKLLCNKYDIYLGSATQLNDTYKDDQNKDSGALKGSKAIIEKADGGILALPTTPKDLKKLESILQEDGIFANMIPNMSYYVFKNRGGKWKSVIVWTKLDMGTMRESDCFVTNYNFELIGDIEKTLLDFAIPVVGDVEMLADGLEVDGGAIASELKRGR